MPTDWSKRDLRERAFNRGLKKDTSAFKLTRDDLLEVHDKLGSGYRLPPEDDGSVRRRIESLPVWAVTTASQILYGLDGLEPYPGQPDVNVRYPLVAGRKLELTIRIAEALIEASER